MSTVDRVKSLNLAKIPSGSTHDPTDHFTNFLEPENQEIGGFYAVQTRSKDLKVSVGQTPSASRSTVIVFLVCKRVLIVCERGYGIDLFPEFAIAHFLPDAP